MKAVLEREGEKHLLYQRKGLHTLRRGNEVLDALFQLLWSHDELYRLLLSAARCIARFDHHCAWVSFLFLESIICNSELPCMTMCLSLSVLNMMCIKFSSDLVLWLQVNNCIGACNLRWFLLYLLCNMLICCYGKYLRASWNNSCLLSRNQAFNWACKCKYLRASWNDSCLL